MGQVTIYLDDEVEDKMRSAAKSMELSQSKWIARLIIGEVQNEWPETVKNSSGSWTDFPSLEEIRSSQSNDSIREQF